MKKSLLLSLILLLFGAQSVFAVALDKSVETYKNGANEIVKAVIDGKVTQQNADQYMKKVDKLIVIGKEIATEMISQKPEGKTLLEFVVRNGGQAKTESIDDITAKWNRGEIFTAQGIEHNKFDRYGPVMAAKDAYIQAIASYVVLKNFRQSGDVELLRRVRQELEEVVGQMQYINK